MDFICDNYPDLKYNDTDSFKNLSDDEFKKRLKR